MYRLLRQNGCSLDVVADRTGTTTSKLRSRLRPGWRPATADEIIAKAERRIRSSRTDVIFAPVASRLVSRIETHVPIVYFSDGTVTSVYRRKPFSDYYRLPNSENASAEEYEGLLQTREKAESETLKRTNMAVYPSQWALASARDDYHVPESRLRLLPIGANLPENDLPTRPPQRECGRPVRLLYVGADWHRKGGDLILSCMDELALQGLPATLTIVGCQPEAAVGRDDIDVIAYLNKNSVRDVRRMIEMLSNHHFLLLPSRAEAYGVAPAEAMAFGLPAIVSGIGGLATVVNDGISGAVLSDGSTGADYANKILTLYDDPDAYKDLSHAAFDDYQRRLAWPNFGRRMMDIFREVVR
tara:strand:- start:112481 stop:113551 length:1071 start_codon:yes stop_codon:yes gene_type:complete